MKKTKFMRAALLLLVLTLITSCFVGGTFAKYTTKAEGSDSARVAKFGVKISATGSDAFSTFYDSEESATVKSSNADKVVAPGTKGSFTAAIVTGSPEVSVKVTNEGTVDLGDNWTANGVYYCPLEVTVGGTTLKGTDAAYTKVEEFEDAIKAAIDGTEKVYAAGNTISGSDSTPAISWEWKFEDTTANAKQTDDKDTALGNAETPATISITVATTVTQID